MEKLETRAGESVEFIVSTGVGMSAASYSLPYLAHWAGGDWQVIAETTE